MGYLNSFKGVIKPQDSGNGGISERKNCISSLGSVGRKEMVIINYIYGKRKLGKYTRKREDKVV